jgi:hypothetical protein
LGSIRLTDLAVRLGIATAVLSRFNYAGAANSRHRGECRFLSRRRAADAASPAFNLKGEAEALSKGGPASTENFREQPVVHGAIGIEDLLAIAARKARVLRRPIFNIDGDAAHDLERLVIGFRRERDDQVEGRVVYAGGDTGLCFDMSMPSFSITALAKGSVVSPGAHAGRTDEDAA